MQSKRAVESQRMSLGAVVGVDERILVLVWTRK